MSHTEVIIIVAVLIAMAINPFVEWWQYMTSITQNISSLEWSINDLTAKLNAFKLSDDNNSSTNKAKLDEAYQNLAIATIDLKLAKQSDANHNHHAAMIVLKDGFSHALAVRVFLES